MTKKRWTNDEVEKLKQVYVDFDIDTLQQTFPNRSMDSILHKGQNLGLFRKLWTEKEVELLTRYYTVMDTKELCKLLDRRNIHTIRKKANQLGLIRPNGVWTREEDEQLRSAYKNLNTNDLYNVFPDRSEQAITSRARELNLKRPMEKRYKRSLNEINPFLSHLNEFELGYLAGLIDGEGHIGAYFCNGTLRARVEIANTDKIMIDWLMERIPGVIYTEVKKDTNRRDTYHWIISGRRRVKQFCQEIAPYLVVKKHIAEKLAQTHADMTQEEKVELVSFVKTFNKTGKH